MLGDIFFSAVKALNGYYHTCLERCKLLKSKGVDAGGVGVDQQFLNNTADKLIYEHAIELVGVVGLSSGEEHSSYVGCSVGTF